MVVIAFCLCGPLEKSMAAVRAVMEGEKKIILTAQKDVNINDVTFGGILMWRLAEF